MGYNTWYNFLTKNNKYRNEDIIEYMKEKNKELGWFYPFVYEIDDFLFDECYDDFDLSSPIGTDTWYDCDKEMLELSRKFPETVFCLYGEGEERDNMWYTYYKNGKMQYCGAMIEFDEYDEAKLE